MPISGLMGMVAMHCVAGAILGDKAEGPMLPAPYAHWLERYYRPGKNSHRKADRARTNR